MLWVAWLVIMADHNIDDEALLFRHLVRLVRDRHQVVDEQLARLVDIDPVEVWRRLDAEQGDLSDILEVANRVATVDGTANALEQAIISELRARSVRVWHRHAWTGASDHSGSCCGAAASSGYFHGRLGYFPAA